MKANFIIPTATDDIFNKVRHLELDEREASELVEKYNEDFKDFLIKTPVVDLTESDRKSVERRVTPPRRESRSKDRSRDRSRSRDRRRRRSRSPPRRRRSRSPPPRGGRGRNRRSPSPRNRRSGGWAQRDRSQDQGWGNKDPYGFNKSEPRVDDLSQYGFSNSSQPSSAPPRNAPNRGQPWSRDHYDNDQWPGFNGRPPRGLERVARINIEGMVS